MKIKSVRLSLLSLVLLGSVTVVSCSSDDSAPYSKPPTESEPTEPGEEAEKATLDVVVKQVTESSVTFTIGAKHAVSAYYHIVDKGVEVSQKEIVEKGVKVEALEGDVTAEGLLPGKEYELYVAALNQEEVVTMTDKGIGFTTKDQVVDVSIALTEVDSTHERVLFTLTPTDAVQARYMVLEKADVADLEITAEFVLENGNNIINLKQPSNLKPKVSKPDTDYVIYAAGLSATGMTVIVSEEVRTKEVPTDPVDDGTLRFSKLNFTGDEVNKNVTYYLYFTSDEWDVTFKIAATDAKEEELKEGKYIRNSKAEINPGPGQVGKSYTILNKKTNEKDTDIDYGDIIITKQGANYKVVVDMVRLSDFKKHFKAEFNGVPVIGEPRP
ncbi:hypothetical protein [Myroides sp. LoEW2-1]|uniref:hypothetical protein n=1 Tax=Myroides sp. LoEW2-1 TaxID=2683192 RepID=UPI001325756F|nr:hypothetical protein [Myroides sp. LoEW2-1]MVX36553.1 hypothetical protein [Myroides sp. LoEW2-1]